jgi:chromate transporter
MTNLIRPSIAVLLGILTYEFFLSSWENAGVLLLEKWKVHPAYVIIGSLVYGGVLLS